MKKLTVILIFVILTALIGNEGVKVNATESVSATSIRGRDLNKDGIIDIKDLAMISLHYGKSIGKTGWSSESDLNSDGIIDIYDLSLVSRVIGTVLINSISLNENAIILGVAGTEVLIPTVNPNEATNKSVTWTSSNNSVATVDSTGKVTGIGAGKAIITATTLDGGNSASCTVTVMSIDGVDQLNQYLTTNYSTVDTVIGKTAFSFTIYQNHNVSFGYDYWIEVNFNLDFFWNKLNDIQFTSAQRTLARQQLKDFQEKLARDIIKLMPTKKLYGGYYTSWYRYPHIYEGFESRSYYTWKNIDVDPYGYGDVYDNAKITGFMWWDSLDDEL